MRNILWWTIWAVPMALWVMTVVYQVQLNATLEVHTRMIESVIEAGK